MEIIFIRESFMQSTLRDIVGFGMLSVAMYLNYTFCGNSKIMSGFFIVCFLLKGFSIHQKGKMTLSEAQKKINKLINTK